MKEDQGRVGPIEHGGDVAAAEAMFGLPAGGWLDLSTGINPHPYPVSGLDDEAWTRLPDSGVMHRLREAAGACYGIADPSLIAPAPGTQALIQWLPRVARRTRVAVLGPTYAEHAASWRAAGHVVSEVDDPNALPGDAAVVILVNPNNPDGRRLEPGFLAELAGGLGRRHGLLVVDEAFGDVAPELSLAGQVGLPGLVVLRSFGKFFGLAGVRLGFALAWRPMAATLARFLGPWAVPGPAAGIATAALADEAWIAVTRGQLASAAERLQGLLEDNGLAVLGGTSLFVLAEVEGARSLHAHMARRGILVRRFPERPTWLRFGLPPDNGAWERIEEGLKSWPGHHRE